MTDPPGAAARSAKVWLLVAAAAVSGGVGYAVFAPKPAAAPQMLPVPAEATAEEVHLLCAACHAYPPPETLPRTAWRKEVKQMYDFFHEASYRLAYPPLEAVVRYYEQRAPEALALEPRTAAAQAAAVRFERRSYSDPEASGPPGVTHVNLVRLFHKDKVDVLVCDALKEQVLVLSAYESAPAWRVIARGLCCAHAEVVDLDGDGINDVVLACLGDFRAVDDRVGSVVWLQGAANGTFTAVTLVDGLGRVADVRAADFTGDGQLDLIVAEFGWHQPGSILLLERQTAAGPRVVFAPRIVDGRHGTTHVPVADLNGDGKPDFVAIISQEHETVVAFVNEGGGRFRGETIYAAPHPAFGCNGVELADLDGDGDVDVVLSNGDPLDPPFHLRPYHSIQWLENEGRYPFTPHRLTEGYGAGSPVIADFDGNGLLDIVYVCYLPANFFPQRGALGLDAVALLDQAAAGKFVRHALETETCDHLACVAGDLDGDGRPELVIGNFVEGGRPGSSVTVWRNTTEKRVGAVGSRLLRASR